MDDDRFEEQYRWLGTVVEELIQKFYLVSLWNISKYLAIKWIIFQYVAKLGNN